MFEGPSDMINECTDCKHCADFHGGFRLFCTHPEKPADAVCDFFPVGNTDAFECSRFEEGIPHHYTWDQLGEAEAYSERFRHGQVTYGGIREWLDIRLGRLPQVWQSRNPPKSDDYIAVLNASGFYFRFNELTGIFEVSGEPMSQVLSAVFRTRLRDLGFDSLTGLTDAWKCNAYENRYRPEREGA